MIGLRSLLILGLTPPSIASLSVTLGAATLAGAGTSPDVGVLSKTLGDATLVTTGTAAPTVSSVTPAFGPEGGGTAITNLVGIGFLSGATVTIGGASATSVVVVSPTQITCVAPTGTFGSRDIVVTNTGGPPGTGAGLFTYYKQADFNIITAGSLSAAALVGATGVATFTRADTSNTNSATCQLSASTLESGVALNRPRIDSNGTIKGLLIEQRMVNRVPTGGARKIATGWVATAQGTQTNNVATGPDGTATAASQCNMNAINQISNYQDFGSNVATRYVFSCWQRSVGTDDMLMSLFPSGGGTELLLVRSGTTTWGRMIRAKGTALAQYVVAVETYDTTASGGQSARARNVYVDFMQLEPGDFPTSAINSSGATATVRPTDYLAWTHPTTANRLRLYMRLYPQFSTALGISTVISSSGLDGQMASNYLYYIDSSNYAYIKHSDNKVYMKVAGSSETASTNAISFANGDDLEVLIEVGNNVASVLKYRVNAGSWTDLVMATFSGNATPGSNVTLCNDTASSDGAPLVCRLRELRAYPIEVATTDL